MKESLMVPCFFLESNEVGCSQSASLIFNVMREWECTVLYVEELMKGNADNIQSNLLIVTYVSSIELSHVVLRCILIVLFTVYEDICVWLCFAYAELDLPCWGNDRYTGISALGWSTHSITSFVSSLYLCFPLSVTAILYALYTSISGDSYCFDTNFYILCFVSFPDFTLIFTLCFSFWKYSLSVCLDDL